MHLAADSPESHFTRLADLQPATENGRRSLSGMRLITTADEERSERELAGAAERGRYCATCSGVDLGGAELSPPQG